MLKDEPTFDAPTPGMSLTHELGARPWQTPPKMVEVDEVIDYYMERMATDVFEDQLVDVLEMDVPITAIVDTIIQGSVMQGIHTIDVGVLVAPVIMEFIMLIGDARKIDYDDGLAEQEGPSKAAINKAIYNFKKARMGEQNVAEEADVPVEEDVTEPESSVSGLMSRRV